MIGLANRKCGYDKQNQEDVEALDEISQNRGILFDPEVVDACLKVFKEKAFKF
jgi:response regulator RpfG family c-di-GMP phosphodiesterase